ncbi:3-oxoacyl-ACP synthase [Photobacterium jeanii]|uniref:3-oxoacyl-ACP synthase n=1 Tax=Photobacterium jeanii TaxID=858640 RepID=A0A178K120_9GAMM|nr:beta-ketoacyl synthase chain length factor [Photobacterium jeanii]OAN11018.1 3-oxoacyl-ACP synthase [Photobacterium jeanii]PST90533.1 3-oxoacyl-ACP synthase [Photobacterium jeanii]
MNNITFNVKKLLPLSAGLTSDKDWQSWANQAHQWPIDASAVPHDLIPAMARRRMSKLSKIAVQAAIAASQEQAIDYIIFSSRHGELTRTVQLLKDIIAGEDASPTAFSQSVHNTAAGLFTILTKQAIPVSSLSAGENTFPSALIEAYAYLAQHPKHKVLVVDFDEPTPQDYHSFTSETYQGYAVAMVIEQGDEFELSWQAQHGETAQYPLPHALNMVSHCVTQQTQWTVESQRNLWHWKKNA